MVHTMIRTAAPRRTKSSKALSSKRKSKKHVHRRCGRDGKHRVTVHVRKCTIRLPRRRPSKDDDGTVSTSRTVRWPGLVTVVSSRRLPKAAVAEQNVWFFPFAVDALVNVCSNAVIDAFRPSDAGGHKIRVPGAKIRRYHKPRTLCPNRLLRKAFQQAQQDKTKKLISNRMLKRWGDNFNDDDDEDEEDEEEEVEEEQDEQEEDDEQRIDDNKMEEDNWDNDDDSNSHCEETGSDVSLPEASAADLWARHDLDEKQQDRVVTRIQKLLRAAKLPGSKQAAANVAKFFLFIHERQCVWMMRKQGKHFLVEDPKFPDGKPVYSKLSIFQVFSFCNNYRELDRGTQYFHSEMLRQWEKQGRPGLGPTKLQDQFKWMKTVLFASYLYRQINRMETFVEFGRGIPTPQQWPAFKKWAHQRAPQRGVAFFTCAHQTIGWIALQTNVNKLLADNHKKLKAITKALVVASSKENGVEACFGVFHKKRVQGCGQFFSWQILSDLLECKCLGHGCNDQQWTKLGPGAKQGMSDIFEGQPTERHLTMAMEFTRLQPRIYEEVLQVEFCKFRGDYLSLKNMEHALCEYSKFVRIEAKLSTGEHCQTRKWRPNSTTKVNKCFGCERNDKKCMSCDTCLNAYCRSCDKSWSGNTEVSWICQRCNTFDSLTFDN